MRNQQRSEALRLRLAALDEWLGSDEAIACRQQKHLDTGSEERAYWHLGYHAALSDLAVLIGAQARPAGTAGIATMSPQASQDAENSRAGESRETLHTLSRMPLEGSQDAAS
jgi:hypothetical protein